MATSCTVQYSSARSQRTADPALAPFSVSFFCRSVVLLLLRAVVDIGFVRLACYVLNVQVFDNYSANVTVDGTMVNLGPSPT